MCEVSVVVGGACLSACPPVCLPAVLTYRGEHLAGADAVVEAHPGVEVGVLAGAQDILVAHVMRLLVGHPVAPAHADGVAAPDVPEGVHAVAAALPVAALEVAALVEDDLEKKKRSRRKRATLEKAAAVLSFRRQGPLLPLSERPDHFFMRHTGSNRRRFFFSCTCFYSDYLFNLPLQPSLGRADRQQFRV